MSLLEVTVTLLLMTVVMGIFYEMFLGSMKASFFTESRMDLSVIGQRASNSIQSDVLQAKLIFEENSTGTGYRTLFTNALPVGTTVWSNSRMPIIDSATTSLGQDPGPNSITNRTGNSLILARHLDPVAISYDHDNNNGTANISFLADRYQFEFVFLRQNTIANFNALGYYLEPMTATSQTVADYYQLSGITINQSQLVTGLRALSPQILLAWDPGKAVSAPAFYNLLSGGTMSSNSSPTFTVTTKSLTPEFSGGRMSGKMGYSVALNSNSLAGMKDVIPLYATASSNFPGGLEFQVVGASGSRKVLSRVVLVAQYQQKIVSRATQTITSARGF